jgi:hypothetical protein
MVTAEDSWLKGIFRLHLTTSCMGSHGQPSVPRLKFVADGQRRRGRRVTPCGRATPIVPSEPERAELEGLA